MNSYLEQAFGTADVTTAKMRAAVRDWFDLYYALPRPGEDAANRLPVVIVHKLCRTVFAEYTAGIAARGRGAAWVRANLQALEEVSTEAMQYALIGGECLIKPVPDGHGGFRFLPIRRDCYVPLGRGQGGRLTAVGTMETLAQGAQRYILLETRTETPAGLEIRTALHELHGGCLGRRVPLNTLPHTARLRPAVTLPGVEGIGMAVLRMPGANCVDGSADAVSVYAAAVGLLHSVAKCEQQLNAELANGASRVFASEDLLRPDRYGRSALRDDLFVGLPDDPANLGVTVYSPALREQSYLARKQDLLRSCENVMGLRRGLLCEAEESSRTATEVSATNVDYDLTVRALQACWERALRSATALCAALGRVYRTAPAGLEGLPDITVDWGDGVLYNRSAVWQEYRQMAADGLLRPEIALAWYFSMPARTPADLDAVRRKLMPAAAQDNTFTGGNNNGRKTDRDNDRTRD